MMMRKVRERSEPEEKTEETRRQRTKRTVREQVSSPWGFFVFTLVALFFIYFGASALGLLPPNLLTNFLSTLTQWARQVGL
jgi:NhaP-type Na+/H+ or K+/H+ antiporter